MKKIGIWLFLTTILGLCLWSCQPEKAKEFRPVSIAENEVDPEMWGKVYPIHYEMYKQSQEPTPAGKSKYKKGWDVDKVIYDKLSEYPFMALLYNGWGFGIEYNEPRSHYYRIIDQLEVDPSRLKPGGVCLSCKTTYAPELEAKYGLSYYNKPYKEVWGLIPERHRKLGDSCLDCHNTQDASLNIRRGFTLVKALETMGVDSKNLTHQQMRSIICAQCHVTYVVPRDKDMKPTGLFFPWKGSKLGSITIENIIKVLKSDPAYEEWKQTVTGFKLAYIRHPEFEFFSNNSIHWNAGVSCSDCHMPYKKMGGFKVSEHVITSPLKMDMKACLQCHGKSAEWLRQQVINVQDRTMSLLLRAGYQTAVSAKLFEVANKATQAGKSLDQDLYSKAKELYLEALYRLIFIGAENSIGFHNPTEAMRILGDAVAFAYKCEAILRTMLANAQIQVPPAVELELKTYLTNRGEKKLNFIPEQEFKDPFGTQEHLEAYLKQ